MAEYVTKTKDYEVEKLEDVIIVKSYTTSKVETE